MGSTNSTQANGNGTRSIARRQEASNRLDDDRDNDVHVWENKQLQLIEECKIIKVLDIVCGRLESLIPNPNDKNSRNEFGNSLRLLAARIDRYFSSAKMQHLRYANLQVHSKLQQVQADSQTIANKLDDICDQEQLSTEGVVKFKEVGQDFLNACRPFYEQLLRAMKGEDLSDIKLDNGLKEATSKFRRFKDFILRKWWWILIAISNGASTGAIAGGVVGAYTPIPVTTLPGIALGAGAGALAGAVGGGAALCIKAIIQANKKEFEVHVESKYKQITFK